MRRLIPTLVFAALFAPASAQADVGPEPEPETSKDETDCSIGSERDGPLVFGLLVLLAAGARLRRPAAAE